MKKLTSPLAAALLTLQPLAAAALPRAASPPPAEIANHARRAQTPAPRPTPAPTPAEAGDSDVVRITTNLVQIDAVVTDRQGRLVTDLGPEDFEILEDGRAREITNFSFVSAGATPAAAGPAPKKMSDAERAATPPVPPARLRPGQVKRTVALVVDDLGTSFESMGAVRGALKKYVDEQMQDGDLVAILRTSAGMGALQQFTTDKRLLHRAIERVRWYPGGRAGVGAFAQIEADPLAQAREQLGRERGQPEEERERARREREVRGTESLDEFREEIFSVGTLGALNYIVRGLRELPGRKSVVLFSDGFEIYNTDNQSTRVLEALRRLTDLANRASVVVYTIDARGLPTLGLTAADDTQGLSTDQLAERLTDRRTRYFNTQDGMNYLAQQTGGFFVKNSNDLAGGVRRALEDQKGFYLIGYRPDEETFDPVRGRGRFNKFEVRLRNRPGLKVRTRSGFFGFTEGERPVRRTRREQLLAAITSPFATSEVPLRLSSIYANEGEKQNSIISLLHIDVSGFKFEEEAEGWRKTVLDVVALTIGENGQIIDEVNRTETVRARAETYEGLLKGGLTYTMRVPVKKPGAYQLRVAVREAASERTGSASQFIEVPSLGKGRLALSGVLLAGSEHAGPNVSAPARGEGAAAPVPDPMSSPYARRFRQGALVDYLLHAYNAKLDPATGKPALQYHARIFRDGQQMFSGKIIEFTPGQQTDMKRLLIGGRLRLGTALQPGEYVLQVIVYDTLAKPKHRMATQWIDFEIVK